MPSSHLRVRPPAVAGSFYPADPGEVASTARVLIEAAHERIASHSHGEGNADHTVDSGRSAASFPKAMIVPHAGWMWSGDLAAQGWARLAPGRGTITRVVLLGPTHRVAIRGIALPGAEGFASPLGVLPVPTSSILSATAHLPSPVYEHSATHAQEHALEVHVPFIQLVLGDVELVPLNVGEASPSEVADVIAAVWSGAETVVAVSTDLSHYLPHTRARQVDDETIIQILSLAGAVAPDRACGARPLNGLLEICRRRVLSPVLEGAHTSADVGGGSDRVVGYSLFTIDEHPQEDPHVATS